MLSTKTKVIVLGAAALLSAGAVALGTPAVGALSVGPSMPTMPSAMDIPPSPPAATAASATWQATPEEIQLSAHTLMHVAIGADAHLSIEDASAATATITAWPENVTRVDVMATDRDEAQAAMGTPGAVTGASGHVLLFQVTGSFVARAFTHPSGVEPPLDEQHYITYAMDPQSGTALDYGMTNTPLLWNTAGVETIFGG